LLFKWEVGGTFVELAKEQKKVDKQEVRAVDNMQVRLLPVLDIMTAIMGQSLATYTLWGATFSPVAGKRIGRNVRHRLHQHFKNREKKLKDEVLAKANKTQDNVPERGGDINAQDNEVFSEIEKKKRENINSLENAVMLLQSDKKEMQEVENRVQSKIWL